MGAAWNRNIASELHSEHLKAVLDEVLDGEADAVWKHSRHHEYVHPHLSGERRSQDLETRPVEGKGLIAQAVK